MSKEITGIKITNAALQDHNGEVVLRGSIDFACLKALRADEYQREILSKSGIGGRRPSKIKKGIEEGAWLPDIELGMRGDNFSAHGKTVVLHDPVYIIDGLQRVNAMLDYLEDHEGIPNGAHPLGATIHLKSSRQWEKERFASLNTLRTPVSPNVLLRNLRDKHPSLLTLYGLSHSDPSFALYERVCWNQRMKQSELLSASAVMRAGLTLHRHVTERTSPTTLRAKRAAVVSVPDRGNSTGGSSRSIVVMDNVAKEIGLQNFRENIKDFFDTIDECWGIRSIEYGEAQGHLKGNFLMVLGGFMSKNSQLWSQDGRRLKIDNKTLARLKTFPVNDPEIRRLSAAGTMVLPTLYEYLLRHMNKGNKKNFFQ